MNFLPTQGRRTERLWGGGGEGGPTHFLPELENFVASYKNVWQIEDFFLPGNFENRVIFLRNFEISTSWKISPKPRFRISDRKALVVSANQIGTLLRKSSTCPLSIISN